MSKSTNGLRKVGLASLAVTLTLGAGAMGAGAANAVEDFSFDRIGGANRYATSALIADEYDETNADVILANGEPGSYADALSANYLAGVVDEPVLLTRDDRTPDEVLAQLEEDGVENITVVGGEGVVSEEQVAALEADGYNVTRISGSDRFLTNAEVIGEGGQAKGGIGIIATGFNFPDALAAGPISYQGHPLGLSTKDEIDQEVIDALKAAGVTKVVIMGGVSAVSAAVEAQLAANDIDVVERFSGENRSETSQLAAEWAVANAGLTNTHVGVASGYTEGYGADALAGGPLEGKEKSPMLITNNVDRPGFVLDYLEDHASTLATGHIYGGTAAVSAAAQAEMEEAASSVSSNQDYTVSGQETATNTVSTSAAPNQGARQYTVSGLDNTKTYDVALFDADNVSKDANGVVKFTDTAGNANEADLTVDTTGGVIEVVNGANNTPADNHVEVAPVNGQITFTVDSTTQDEIVPVVWLDAEASDDDALDLDANDQPTENFGVGGRKNWIPSEATSGGTTTGGEGITSVNKESNYFITDAGTASDATDDVTYFYDENDTFRISNTAGNCVQVTAANWESNLSAGDTLNGESSYNADPQFASNFCIDDDAPAEPTGVSATQSGGTVTINWTDPTTGNPDSYNIYRAVDTDDTDQSTGTGTTDGSSCPAADSTAYTLVKSVAGTLNTTTDAPATADTYCYRVTAVDDGDESAQSNASDVTIPQPAETVRPTITDARLLSDTGLQGIANLGDQFRVTFSEDMDATTASGGAFVLQDADGDRFTVECGTGGATCSLAADSASNADRVLTVTLGTVSDGNTAGDGDLEWPATIATTDADVRDEADNVVDLANSADVVVDTEA